MNNKLILISAFILLSTFLWAQPQISFFNEMKSPDLVELFKDSTVMNDLKKLKAQVRMGMLDLTPERAEIIRQLNHAGIPVVAWLLLSESDGYWFTLHNGDQAIRRYREITEWGIANDVRFHGIGLDMELDMNDVKLMKSSPWKLISKLPGRLYDHKTIANARIKYDSLLRLIRADGYFSESYYASFVKDEVNLGNTALQQLTGFMDIPTDREIPMLYSSFIGNPDGLLTIYGKEAGVMTVGLGSTGGGFDPSLPSLTYAQLVHDINFASAFASELHIFSLEGCVQKGYLSRLAEEKIIPNGNPDPDQVKSTKRLQSVFKRLSRMLSYPTLFFTGLIAGVLITLILIFLLIRYLFRLIRRRI
jgi:hypothetical protein